MLLALLTTSVAISAQTKPKRDSLYDKIEIYSKKRKISKFLYHLIFRNISDAVAVPNSETATTEQFKGKYIRNIYITSYDPLGYNSKMEKRDSKWFETVGNRLHRNSRNFAVRGYLLFKKGDEYNEQKLYESERILRDTKFINRASIKAIDSTATQDSVDIAVRVLDSWSLRPSGSFSGQKMGIGLTEENFLGMGHEVSAVYRTHFKTKQNYALASYAANNIYGTYINAKILAENDFDNNENVYFRIYREFFSPLTKWAGGATIDYYKRNFQLPTALGQNPDTFPVVTAKVHNQDFWWGYQIPIKSASVDKITDNVAFAARFQNLAYLEAPGANLDPGSFFQAYKLYLGSISYTKRKFEVKKNVFNYEMPEDIPHGALVSLTGGAMKYKNLEALPYIGITGGYGFFSKLGYLNYRVSYGTFFKEEKNYRSTFRADGTYFSPLRHYGRLNLRHFLSETLVLGNNRNTTFADRLNLSARSEFPEYNPNFIGKDKFVLRYQLQFFLNKTWKNFQINPYFMTTLGWLSDDVTPLLSSKTHMKFGLGIHFYNPYLAFNRFQVSFVYYPRLPFDEHPAFDLNGYRNNYMPINNFSIGEPSILNYSN